ncbi:MAG: hypothetical protein K0Q77_2039 [Anaerosporomusa subterranea]|jgi:hypothetical protein|nr:hypothetical protein [Anaerosporomusa subterranea]
MLKVQLKSLPSLHPNRPDRKRIALVLLKSRREVVFSIYSVHLSDDQAALRLPLNQVSVDDKRMKENDLYKNQNRLI